MKKQKHVQVVLTATDTITVGDIRKPTGWGDAATEICLEGAVTQILIRRGNKAQVGLRILEDGSVILTSYDSAFTAHVESNLRLDNSRPWK